MPDNKQRPDEYKNQREGQPGQQDPKKQRDWQDKPQTNDDPSRE